ncbi:MAG: anti-sigma factor [Nitrospira sp.]|nr:anti-sigma factor [Nitrospira sp.]
MTHQELEDAIPLYVIGALERGERQALDAHLLSGCSSCHSALREFQAVAAALPFGLDLVTPPRLLRATILTAQTAGASPDMTGQPSNGPRLAPGKWMDHVLRPEISSTAIALKVAAGLAVVVILAAGLYAAWTEHGEPLAAGKTESTQQAEQAAASQLAALQEELEERERLLDQTRKELHRRMADIAELKDQLIQREAELDVLKTHLDQQEKRRTVGPEDELASLLRTPAAPAIVLTGTDSIKRPAGILLYDRRTRKLWLYALNLPECPPGMEYRVWALSDNEKPVGLGAFRVGKGEVSHLFVKPAPGFTGFKTFSVSLEPIGGSSQPAGMPYLQGHA